MNDLNIKHFFLGVAAGLLLAGLVAALVAVVSEPPESKTILRMTLEDGRRIHLPLSPHDEKIVDKNGGEIKIKTLEFRRKE